MILLPATIRSRPRHRNPTTAGAGAQHRRLTPAPPIPARRVAATGAGPRPAVRSGRCPVMSPGTV